MSHRRIAIVAVLAALSVSSAAPAATFTTPTVLVSPNQRIQCLVTNVGKSDLTVSVSLLTGNGIVTPYGDTCNSPAPPLAPNKSCSVSRTFGDGGGFCRVVAKGSQLRASITVDDSGGKFDMVVPATKK
jgi:hypothetical protein